MPVLKCGKISESVAEQCRYHFSLWSVKNTRKVSLPVICSGCQNMAEKFRFHFSVHGAKIRQNSFAPTAQLCISKLVRTSFFFFAFSSARRCRKEAFKKLINFHSGKTVVCEKIFVVLLYIFLN